VAEVKKEFFGFQKIIPYIWVFLVILICLGFIFVLWRESVVIYAKRESYGVSCKDWCHTIGWESGELDYLSGEYICKCFRKVGNFTVCQKFNILNETMIGVLY